MKSIKVAWLILLLASAAGVAQAQGVGASGDIKGTVTDPSGAVLPNAAVTATEAERGLQHKTRTDPSGQYLFTGLMPGAYDLTVELSGFQTQIHKGVIVNVGQTTIIDFRLKVSATATSVVVTGEPPLIDTERGQQANTIGQTLIEDLPINRRDYLSFTLLLPGVSNSTRLADD